ncbi:hypothetical protein FQN52_000290 [Onygenales sp. PD_12]|nr:hypothetical protein FQN52_000290 [Onygenales sp. PD_12]
MDPPLPPAPPRTTTTHKPTTTQKLLDLETSSLGAAPSSDPPLFSSDDFQSSALENYHYHSNSNPKDSKDKDHPARRVRTGKRLYRGTWWGEEEEGWGRGMGGGSGSGSGKKRRTEFKEKRNVDSGVWLGSDDSVEGEGDGMVIAAGYQAVVRTPRKRGYLSAAVAPWVEGAAGLKAVKRVEEPYEHRQARRVVSECLEAGREYIDLSNLNLHTIPPGLLRPIAQFTKEPAIANVDMAIPLTASDPDIVTDTDAPPTPSYSYSYSADLFTPLEPSPCLFLTNNHLTTLPADLFDLHNLKALSIRHNNLREFPSSIANLTKLHELNLAGNQLQHLPWQIMQLLRVPNSPLRHLTVHPNPFVQPTLATVEKWHCQPPNPNPNPKTDDGEEPEPRYLLTPNSNTETQPGPIPIATGKIHLFDPDGRPIPHPHNNNSNNHTPSLRELALRAYNRTSTSTTNTSTKQPLSHTPQLTASLPPIPLALLQRAEKVREVGGKRCAVCERGFVIARGRWVEWWDCEGVMGGGGGGGGVGGVGDRGKGVERELRPLPFLREVCCWGCVGVGRGWEG